MKAQVSLKMGPNSRHIARALMDEAKNGLPKVEVDVIPAGEKVKIEIEAEDFTSLRAALNSFLGWAYCADGVVDNG
ncbi:MAG: KEOPS complex subunit Pcc1 [Candidatus Thermoplasmatota archaeon]|nr:KEOPS complex subunit Pcc1 [Candidatus Thermoplasmatota archaeon]